MSLIQLIASGAAAAAPPTTIYEDTFDDASLVLLTSRMSIAPTHTSFQWVHDSSSAGGDTWSADGAGLVFRNGGSGHEMYTCVNLGAADHWFEIDVAAMATAQGTGFFVRGTSGTGLTYAGCELGGVGAAGLRLEAYEGSTSARRLIDLQGYAGKTIRVEAEGTTFRVWTEWGFADNPGVNFEEVTDSGPLIQSGTYVGIYGHVAAGGNKWITAFRAGAL